MISDYSIERAAWMHASQIKTYMPRRPGRKEAMFSVAMRNICWMANDILFACQFLFVLNVAYAPCSSVVLSVTVMSCECVYVLICISAFLHVSCFACRALMFTRLCFTCQDVGGLVGTPRFLCVSF